MKKICRLISLLLVILMLFSPLQAVLADDGESENLIQNPSFTDDIWGENKGWDINVSDWTNFSLANSEENKKSDPSALKYAYWTQEDPGEGNVTVTLSQNITLSKGDYELEGFFYGGASVPSFYVKDIGDSEDISLTGWKDDAPVWDKGTFEFSVNEEKEYEVGIKIIVDKKNMGWGFVDDINLQQVKDTAVEASITVPKVKGLPEEFIKGVDCSSVISLEKSGVKYRDMDGNEKDLFQIMKDSGVNYSRVRIWNDPYDSKGNGYGGGNNDLEKAKIIGKRSADAGLKLLVDFHYSDFWASPGLQITPKEWQGLTLDERADKIYEYTLNSLKALKDSGSDIGMVQIGNETSHSVCGAPADDWESIAKLFSAGSRAVREFEEQEGLEGIKVALHFTNPEKGISQYADYMAKYNVDYDAFGVSYYAFWHGSLANLKKEFNKIVDKHHKEVFVAETSYPYTLKETDGHNNTVGEGSKYETGDNMQWAYSVKGQANAMRDLIDTVNQVNDGKGIGVFYWEPAWITVGDTTGLTGTKLTKQIEANRVKWYKYGSGWASKYAKNYTYPVTDKNGNTVQKVYSSNVVNYPGGCSVENQAMFDTKGRALDSLNVFKYIYTGSRRPGVELTSFESVRLELLQGTDKEVVLPETVSCTFSDDTTKDVEVKWNQAKYDAAKDAFKNERIGTFTVRGTIQDRDNTSINAVIQINPVNYVDNCSFEDGMNGWEMEGSGAVLKEDEGNARTGKHAVNFWTGESTSEVTIKKTITGLEDGTYSLSTFIQGENITGNSEFTLWYRMGEGEDAVEKSEKAELKGWADWQNPTFGKIKITGGEITIGLTSKLANDGENGDWAWLDDFMLYKPTLYTVKYSANKQAKVTGIPSAHKELLYSDTVKVKGIPSSSKAFFYGWNTQANGKGKSYVKGKTFKVAKNTTLYAQWKKTYKDAGGIKYQVIGAKQVAVTGFSGTKTKVKIPKAIKVKGNTYRVVKIAKNAFRSKKKIKAVSIGNNVITIGHNAFYGCKSLKKVAIGTGLKTVGKNVFTGVNKKCTVKINSTKLKTVQSVLNKKKSAMTIKVGKKVFKKYRKLLLIDKMKGKVKYGNF